MKTNYFDNIDGLEKLLKDYSEIFEMIDDFGQQLIAGIPNTPDDYKEILDKLTGAYISLEPLYTQAEAKKLNEELQAYVDKKRELEEKGDKIVSATLDREASLAVADYRRIRAVLEGYVEACGKGISTCQTQLRRIEFSWKNKNTQINE